MSLRYGSIYNTPIKVVIDKIKDDCLLDGYLKFVPTRYSHGESTPYSNRLHDFYATIVGCYKQQKGIKNQICTINRMVQMIFNQNTPHQRCHARKNIGQYYQTQQKPKRKFKSSQIKATVIHLC